MQSSQPFPELPPLGATSAGPTPSQLYEEDSARPGLGPSLTPEASPSFAPSAALPPTFTQEPRPAAPALPHLRPQGTPAAPLAPALAPAPNGAAAARRGAGMGVLLATGGLLAGAVLGGAWGAGAGLLLVGAFRNASRARRFWGDPAPGQRHEAAKSATLAVFGAGVGSYLAYRAYQVKE